MHATNFVYDNPTHNNTNSSINSSNGNKGNARDLYLIIDPVQCL